MVSGGLAVMKQLFRGQLSNTELVSRLFATANKKGIYANRAVYGQGLMNLGAATNPWGIPAFRETGQSVGQRAQVEVTRSNGEVEPSRTNACAILHQYPCFPWAGLPHERGVEREGAGVVQRLQGRPWFCESVGATGHRCGSCLCPPESRQGRGCEAGRRGHHWVHRHWH